ncbi:MAG: SIMPL domain-containing protein [Oceanicola sp.]|nr:SIMPL domain-containing protein [Oceanicola sp.]
MKRRSMIGWAGVCLLLAIAVPVGASAEQSGRLQVSGEGLVTAVPDSAELRLSVLSTGPRAKPAMDELARKLADVLEALKASGIAERDLQTTSLRLDPVFAPYNDREPGQAPKIDGYRASTGLTIRVSEIGNLGDVADSALSAGANRFEGVSFTLSDSTQQMSLARTLAVEDAMRKATTYAEAAGVALGDIREIAEAGARTSPPMMAMADMRSESTLQMAPGELEFRATVNMVFDISPTNP